MDFTIIEPIIEHFYGASPIGGEALCDDLRAEPNDFPGSQTISAGQTFTVDYTFYCGAYIVKVSYRVTTDTNAPFGAYLYSENVKARQRVNIMSRVGYYLEIDNEVQDFIVPASDGQINQPVEPNHEGGTSTEIDISNIAWTWTVSP